MTMLIMTLLLSLVVLFILQPPISKSHFIGKNLILILTFNILITKLINTTEKFLIANFFIYIYIYIEKTNRFSISQKLTACIKLFHNIKSPLPKQKQLNRHQEKLSVMSSE